MPFSKKPAKFSCFFFHPNTAGTARSTIMNHSTAFLYKYKISRVEWLCLFAHSSSILN